MVELSIPEWVHGTLTGWVLGCKHPCCTKAFRDHAEAETGKAPVESQGPPRADRPQ